MTLPALVIAVVAAAATSVHFPVTTRDPAAQAAIDRGLFLYYAYDGDEAARSFEQAASLDAGLSMAGWGIALAEGPDLNTPLSAAQFLAAQRAIRHAVSLEGSASPDERRYLDIMASRYAGTFAGWQRDDAAYRSAMLALAKSGNDENAKLLAAEALLEHGGLTWQNGQLTSEDSRTALGLVSDVLQDDPRNPMANHLCIHLYDLAPDRRPAKACALRLDAAAFPPEAEHLTHMPAHYWIETGEYTAALASSERTYAALQNLQQSTQGAQHANKYARHDIMVGYSAAMMLGSYSNAQRWSQRVSGAYNSSFAALTALRFGRYEDAAAAGASYGNPSVGGLATLHLQHAAEATSAAAVAARDVKGGYLPQLFLSRVAESAGRFADARDWIAKATDHQAATSSGELIPLLPAGEALGFFEMRRGQNAAAIAAFTQTLAAYPNDPRALYGLAAALTAAGRNAEAQSARARFEVLWKGADTTLAGADFP